MKDPAELFAQSILVIKFDKTLKECFTRILKFGPSSLEVRVHALQTELIKMGAPEEVRLFFGIIKEERIAQLVLNELAE